MNLHELNEIDLKSLPEKALVAIREAVKEELKSRGKLKAFRDYKMHSLAKNRHHAVRSPDRIKYLPDLIAADWTDLYPHYLMSQERKFYVYAHVDISAGIVDLGEFVLKGLPFYIGKGAGNRAFDLKRNEGHGAELRSMRAQGRMAEEIVQILKSEMTEQEALCYEAKLIHFFGTRFDGVKNGLLVNLTKPVTPYD